LNIAHANLNDPEVQALIALHQQAMLAGSPQGLSFALDLGGLETDTVTVWEARIDGRVAAIGAMKRLNGTHGEIKSMRTHPDYLRRGLGSALLETIIAHARTQDLRILSLETGSGPAFDPALALYRKRGFNNGAAFSDYTLTDFNQCLHMALN